VSLVVVKGGGGVPRQTAAAALAAAAAGHRVCVVHGAGAQISREMERQGIEIRFVGGRRVTSRRALRVVRESLRAVNRELCAAIGPSAIGFMGDGIGLEADRIPELGLVGEPRPSRPEALLAELGRGRIPVVAPLATGPLNVNADEAAAALAVGLGADRLCFVVDVPGVLLDGRLLASIGADETRRLLNAGTFEGGIVPKLRAATRAAQLGLEVQIGGTAVLSPQRT
jgi:acetylglutamate kinase